MRLDHLLSKENSFHTIFNIYLKHGPKNQEEVIQNWKVIRLGTQDPQVELFHNSTWGCSSVGRAPALQAGGQEFESPHLHQS